MLLGRIFSYADTHRYRIGPNYMQLPVNAPKSPVHSYSKDGPMRYQNAGDPVYAPNSYGGPAADTARFGEAAGWEASSSEMARSAYVQHAEDDDWTQPGTMVREVLDDAARERLVNNIVGHLLNAVSEPVLQRACEYWRNVDKNLGDKVEAGVRAKQGEKDPKAAEQANPAREGRRPRHELRVDSMSPTVVGIGGSIRHDSQTERALRLVLGGSAGCRGPHRGAHRVAARAALLRPSGARAPPKRLGGWWRWCARPTAWCSSRRATTAPSRGW
jgi:Catalase